MDLGKQMLAESKFYMGYSRWVESDSRYESWEESVKRVMDMHRKKYKNVMTDELETLIQFAESAYTDKLVLGAQRALQFGGDQLFKHEARMYNCSVSYIDRPAFFNEAMYLLLCGCGVGFSVQRHHIDKLPQIARRSQKKVKIFKVPDSIEGWADAFAVLLSSYFLDGGERPEYKGCQVHFDYTDIRPKGAEISGGFKAPGPDGLRAALVKCEALLENLLREAPIVKINSITAYDFVMHMSDAVLSGGVRRSATICVFDKDDNDMLTAKTGNWYFENPQRGRSNNSIMIIRDELERDEWANIMKSVKSFGEPGFIFADNKEFLFNPCVEIGMLPRTIEGISGFQFCNLTEINGGQCVSKEIMLRACKAAAILGTLQAGYTNFAYVSPATKEITEREALIGVSITGWMNNPDVLFVKENMIAGAEEVKAINKLVADMIGINQAARTTCVKPSGNASTMLGTASATGGEHAPKYLRLVQMNKEDEVTKIIMRENPRMIEESAWSANGSDVVVAFPIVSKEGSIYKNELLGSKQLEYVKLVQQYWIEYGTNVELCADERLRHNVSNTISVDDWDDVEEYLFENRKWFAGVSLLSSTGDKDYVQAPFTEVLDASQILATYGEGIMMASGLIVDALHCFNDNLWIACDTVKGKGLNLSDDSTSNAALKKDWVRRAKKYAENYFEGDLDKMTYGLKDCYNLHKWLTIVRDLKPINFATDISKKEFVDVDTLGSQACSGGACEISF